MRWKLTNSVLEPPRHIIPSIEEKIIPGRTEEVIKGISLVTPMLGGGVKSFGIDSAMPIRAASIRGHLRFWWRTFQDCADVKALREKEKALWGSTENASKVTVRVQITNPGRPVEYKKDTKANATELPKYVIFPLDNTKDENGRYVKAFTLKEGISFDLHLTYPSDRKRELFTAVKLWLLFGGIGARTRRGMGSLYCGTWTGWQSREKVVGWLQEVIPAGNPSGEPKWPSLIGGRLQLIEKDCHTNIMKLWRGWINNYQRFRQFRVDKHTGEKNDWGHSVWPEPNAIRTLYNSGNFGKDAYFPRGAYGLPIPFHFGEQNPLNCMLYGFSDGIMERWSSPVILKVARLNQDKCIKICLKLNSPLPEGWCLKRESDEKKLPPSAYPMADRPAKHGDTLNGNDPYTALFKAMASEDPMTLGKGGRV